MSVKPTSAANVVAQHGEELSSHQLISLLMDGMLERVTQAKKSILDDDLVEKEILFKKIIAILNGLRSSLNFQEGGEIALNLETLYVYMIERIETANSKKQECEVLDEVRRLVSEVKEGWDNIYIQKQAKIA